MSKLTWIPPLPPGYEARWDHNQKAYFFINHSDKSTTWHDPRPEYYAKQPKDHPPPNPKHSAAGQPVFGFRGSGIGPKKEQTFLDHQDVKFNMLKEMFPDVADDTLKIVLKMKDNNVQEARAHLVKSGHKTKRETDHSSAGQLQMDNIVKKLQKVYPLARFDIIRDIVAGCNNNESTARTQIESMGYKPVGSHTTSISVSHKPKPKSRSPSPTPPKISDAEKRRVFQKMKGEFSDMEESFIKMALESVHYNEANFKRMVEINKQSGSGAKGSSASSTRGRATKDDDLTFKPTGSLIPESFSGGMEPVVFGHDYDDRPSSSTAFTVPFGTPKKSATKVTKTTTTIPFGVIKTGTKISSEVTKTTAKKPAQPKKESIDHHAARIQAEKKSHGTQQTRAKHVTHTSPTHVVVNQPRSHLAKGPDPDLRKGPDKELLLTEYVNVYGPNPDLRDGPDRNRVQGSQGAVGPDPSLVCGPQAVHHSFDMHSFDDNRPLVTAI